MYMYIVYMQHVLDITETQSSFSNVQVHTISNTESVYMHNIISANKIVMILTYSSSGSVYLARVGGELQVQLRSGHTSLKVSQVAMP